MADLPTLSPYPVKTPSMFGWAGPVWLATMLTADLLLLGPTAGSLLCRLPALLCLLGWWAIRPAGWPWPTLTALTAIAGQAVAIGLWAGAGAAAVPLAAGALALALPAALLGNIGWPLLHTAPAGPGAEAGNAADLRTAESSVPKPVLRIAGDGIQARLAILGDGLDRLAYGADGARIRPLCIEVKQIRTAVEQTLGAPPQQPARPLRDPPMVTNAAPPPAHPVSPAIPVRRALSILLVDDDVVGRTLTRLLLEKGGHEVEETDDAKMALEMALMEGPELALISARIGRHRGLALAWCIHRGKGPPVILLRGPADRAMEADIQRAGLQGVLEKPVTPARLEAALGAFLASASPTEEASPAGAELNQELLADHLRLLGPERLGQIIDSFLSNGPETLENAAKAAREGDVHNLGRAAHKLASGALTVGAATLATLAKGIDTAAKRNEGEAALGQAKQLPAQWLEAKAALTRFRQGL